MSHGTLIGCRAAGANHLRGENTILVVLCNVLFETHD